MLLCAGCPNLHTLIPSFSPGISSNTIFQRPPQASSKTGGTLVAHVINVLSGISQCYMGVGAGAADADVGV